MKSFIFLLIWMLAFWPIASLSIWIRSHAKDDSITAEQDAVDDKPESLEEMSGFVYWIGIALFLIVGILLSQSCAHH